MAIRWKRVGGLSILLSITAAIGYGLSVLDERRTAGVIEEVQANRLLPLATGLGADEVFPVDPRLHCVALPTGIRLSPQRTAKHWMDHRFHGTADWTVISDRMKSGDDIYAYDSIVHPLPGTAGFTGLDGGYVVLRGWCLIGRFGTWVE